MESASVTLITLFVWLAQLHLQTKGQQLPPSSIDDDPYWHRRYLGPGGNYQVEWQVDWGQERVLFNVTAATLGYVGMGLSRNGALDGADIVVGGVNPDGSSYFSDRHAFGDIPPEEDTLQNWELRAEWENETHTFLSFSRAFDTCDPQDVPISDDSLYLLWAVGNPDGVTEFDFDNGGSSVVYLRDPDLTPRSIMEENGRNPDISTRDRAPVYEGDTQLQIWEINQRFEVPPQRTTYMCFLKKFSPPAAGRKHHLIGSNARITPPGNMHHLLLFRCRPPAAGISAPLLYEPFMDKPQPCYSLAQLMGPIQTEFCNEIVAGQAIGGTPFFHHEEMGIPIGETAPVEYFAMQVHYDNPGLVSNLTVNIEWDLYYTPRLRNNDGSILSLGHTIPGAPSILFPPGERDHRFFGHCSPYCTGKMLPPQGIRVSAALLHSHGAGRRLRVQHFRNGRELPWILNDDNYQFTFQPFRNLREEIVVLPGDQVSVQCYFDTTNRNRSIVGGYETTQEMCKTFMVYWNKLDNFPMCWSHIDDADYKARYLAGLRGQIWDPFSLEFRATSPLQIAGRTLSNISDTLVNWSAGLRQQLRRDHIVHPQRSVCPGLVDGVVNGILEFFGFETEQNPVSFPASATPYQPPNRCSLRG